MWVALATCHWSFVLGHSSFFRHWIFDLRHSSLFCFQTADLAARDEAFEFDDLGESVFSDVACLITDFQTQIHAARHAWFDAPEILPGVRQACGDRGPRTLRIGGIRERYRARGEPIVAREVEQLVDRVELAVRHELGHERLVVAGEERELLRH